MYIMYCSLLTFLNTFVSSANFSTLLVMLSSKSLIHIKKNKDPNNDLCGTTLTTDFEFETLKYQYVACYVIVEIIDTYSE